MPVHDLASASHAAEALSSSFPRVVVTAGGAGVVGKVRNEPSVLAPARAVTVVSTHGAGDMFVGTLAVALAQGDTLAIGLERANAAAAEHVSGSRALSAGV